jgi:hypothetical protein
MRSTTKRIMAHKDRGLWRFFYSHS